MKKLTPVLLVEEIEPCLAFWVERLGFQKVTEVPEGNKLGFVILVKDCVTVEAEGADCVIDAAVR